MATNEQLNVTQLMTGKDGELHVTIGDKSVFLAEINQFSTNMEFSSTDVQPVSSGLIYDVITGWKFNLTFTEMVVRDDVIIEPLLEAVAQGKVPTFDFRGVMNRPDGMTQSITYNNCNPNGTFGLQNLNPGEVVTREQSFRVNSVPKFLSKLASEKLAEV